MFNTKRGFRVGFAILPWKRSEASTQLKMKSFSLTYTSLCFNFSDSAVSCRIFGSIILVMDKNNQLYEEKRSIFFEGQPGCECYKSMKAEIS
jgi:hypothetical protein